MNVKYMKFIHILCCVVTALLVCSFANAQDCVTTTTKKVIVKYDIPDAAKPGVVWVALTSASNWSSHVLLGNGQWVKYQGGLYQPYADYRSQGLPKAIQFEFSTEGIPVDWKINIGYGLESSEIAATLQTINKHMSESAFNEISLKMIQREMINMERFLPAVRIGNCLPSSHTTPTDHTMTRN